MGTTALETVRVDTARLELRPMPPQAAELLPRDRAEAGRLAGAALHPTWPEPPLLGILHRQGAALPLSALFGIWMVVERESATVVGDAGFHGPPDVHGTVEVGYSIVPDRRRRGYATEAVRALIDWAVGRDDVRQVVAGCDPANAASIATLESLGFHRSGEAAGELRWHYRGDSRRDRRGGTMPTDDDRFFTRPAEGEDPEDFKRRAAGGIMDLVRAARERAQAEDDSAPTPDGLQGGG